MASYRPLCASLWAMLQSSLAQLWSQAVASPLFLGYRAMVSSFYEYLQISQRLGTTLTDLLLTEIDIAMTFIGMAKQVDPSNNAYARYLGHAIKRCKLLTDIYGN